MAEKQTVRLRVNGQEYEGACEPRKLLVDFIREDLRLTGTHVGCEHGVCGACTILMDGLTVRSCLMFAVQANGTELMTVEGWRRATSYTRSSRRSGTSTGCSAASARRAF